jgi:transcriptional regulator with PAS, ATPase and Fis domain
MGQGNISTWGQSSVQLPEPNNHQLSMYAFSGATETRDAGQQLPMHDWPVIERGNSMCDAQNSSGGAGRSVVHALNPRPSHPFGSPTAKSETRSDFPGVKGSSLELRQAIDKAKQLAGSRAPILLLGETGVGKEVFAKGIHALSRMSSGPFVALNCGGLSRELLASELFGHVDGAFTGARRGGMAGKLEAADGGTLLLDELGEMPLDLQPQFLRVLEDGLICRLGETKPRHINFRLIAATNRDLRQEVAEGRFRADLFYRISVTSIQIPALRKRGGDIRELAQSFVRELCARHEIKEKIFHPMALDELERCAWPGNIRELRNTIEGLVLTVSGEVIGCEDLPPEILSDSPASIDLRSVASPVNLSSLAKSEFEQICKILRKTSGNATLAAKQLGIAKSTLYLKLKKYSLDESLDNWRTA